RTQRPQLDLGIGASFSPWISFGVGMHIAFSISSEADVFLNSTSSADKTSTMRVKSSLKPKIGPYFGLMIAPPAPNGKPDWSLGLVTRLAVSSPAYFEIHSGAQAVTGVAAVTINLSAVSVL